MRGNRMIKSFIFKLLIKVIGFFLDLFRIEIDINYDSIFEFHKKMDDEQYQEFTYNIEAYAKQVKLFEIETFDIDQNNVFVKDIIDLVLIPYVRKHILQGVFIYRIIDGSQYNQLMYSNFMGKIIKKYLECICKRGKIEIDDNGERMRSKKADEMNKDDMILIDGYDGEKIMVSIEEYKREYLGEKE